MKLRHIWAAIGLAGLLSASNVVLAQPGHRGGDHGNMAQQGYMEAMQRMHAGMMRVRDPDPSRAWALQMIEHHQGAIEMSRVVLAHTRDPQIRRMANQAIAAQTREIGELRRWLARNGGPRPRG